MKKKQILHRSSSPFEVGFLMNRWQVKSPHDIRHTPQEAKELAVALKAFVNQEGLRGDLFKIFLVRVHQGRTLLAAQVSQKDSHPVSPDVMDGLKKSFQETFSAKVDSLWWQTSTARHHGLSADFEWLGGERFLVEHVSGRQFAVSPASFFQTNTTGCQLLYDCIRDYATSPHKTGIEDQQNQRNVKRRVLLDLCCGTGTIALALSPYFDHVIGIECVKEAVADARFNASTLNSNVSNVTFVEGRLEDILNSTLTSYLANSANVEFTVVLDPPRAGAHPSVIKTIRGEPLITRLIYVSCAPEQAFINWQALLTTQLAQKTQKTDDPERCEGAAGGHFVLKRARAVDMFPHTEHCEAVLLFERHRQE